MHRLRPRSIARQINHKRTLPQRLWRELLWFRRDWLDFCDELRTLPAGVKGIIVMPIETAEPMTEADIPEGLPPLPRQSEMNDPRDRSDGVW